MLLVHASSLQIGSFTPLYFCEQQKQLISLLHNVGKQRNGHLIFALTFKQKSMDGLVQRKGIFFAHQQNEREKVPQAPDQWNAKANFAVKGPNSEDFFKSFALAKMQFLVRSLGISIWTQIEWND